MQIPLLQALMDACVVFGNQLTAESEAGESTDIEFLFQISAVCVYLTVAGTKSQAFFGTIISPRQSHHAYNSTQ